jgi:hypothetical protein
MKLFTKEIEAKLQHQYPLGSDMQQMVICKIFDPAGSWTWYIMNQDPDNPDYLWGIVQGFEVESGSIWKPELEEIGRLERDLYWIPISAQDVRDKLMKGEHV